MNLETLLELRPKVHRWKSQEYHVVEEKHDGYRVTIMIDGGEVVAVQRKAVDIWPKLQVIQSIKAGLDSLPQGTVLDGELIAVGKDATSVPTAIKEGEGLQFIPFAMPYYDGWDLRRDSFHEHRERMKRLMFQIPRQELLDVDEEFLLQEARDRGIEGFVLKAAVYDSWYKVKPTETIDVVVMECHMGTGDNSLNIGSVTVGVYKGPDMLPLANIKLQQEEDRLDFTSPNCRSMEGRVMEVEYDSIGAKGRLKFPRFVRWRDDEKFADECTIGQLR